MRLGGTGISPLLPRFAWSPGVARSSGDVRSCVSKARGNCRVTCEWACLLPQFRLLWTLTSQKTEAMVAAGNVKMLIVNGEA